MNKIKDICKISPEFELILIEEKIKGLTEHIDKLNSSRVESGGSKKMAPILHAARENMKAERQKEYFRAKKIRKLLAKQRKEKMEKQVADNIKEAKDSQQ